MSIITILEGNESTVMDKAEAREKIKETVLYLLDTDDKEVVDHYVDILLYILEQYTQQVSRERAIRYADAFHNCMSDKDVTGLTAFEVYDRWWNKVRPL